MSEPRKIVIHHGLDVGDCAMMTIAIRDLHLSHPGEYITDVRTRWPDLWLNNPYITKLEDSEAEKINIGYPLIQNPGSQSFSDGFRLDLADKLKIEIPFTNMNIDLHLSMEEKKRNIVNEKFQYSGKYWILNGGYKADAILKYYPFWQEVVDELKNSIQVVQVGSNGDVHPELDSVFSLVGETSLRELIQVIYRSEGTIGPISAQFVLSTAFNKPSVIVAGGKEPARWQMYNYHRYLYVGGCLPCCANGGCWTAKFQDCKSRVGNVPRCFAMISPKEVARNVLLYYDGGLLSY